jgi:hypothetical protein
MRIHSNSKPRKFTKSVLDYNGRSDREDDIRSSFETFTNANRLEPTNSAYIHLPPLRRIPDNDPNSSISSTMHKNMSLQDLLPN